MLYIQYVLSRASVAFCATTDPCILQFLKLEISFCSFFIHSSFCFSFLRTSGDASSSWDNIWSESIAAWKTAKPVMLPVTHEKMRWTKLFLCLGFLCLLVRYSLPLFRDGPVYFCKLRFCTMTSPGLFHLSVDGFQADVLLCLCVCPPVLSFRREQRKGCSESYTPAFPTTSQVHLKMRSDDTRAPGAPLSLSLLLSLPHSPFLFLPHTLWTLTSTVACFDGRELLSTSGTAGALPSGERG